MVSAWGIIDDQVMAVVRGNDQDPLVPVAVSFNPADQDQGANGLLAAEDGADGIIQVVGVQREIDVAGLDEQDEGLTRMG